MHCCLDKGEHESSNLPLAIMRKQLLSSLPSTDVKKPATLIFSPLDHLRRIDIFNIFHYVSANHQQYLSAYHTFHQPVQLMDIQMYTFPANQVDRIEY